MRIELADEEWRQVLAILAQAPWSTANPLIMKIAEQMRLQTQPAPVKPDGEDRPTRQ